MLKQILTCGVLGLLLIGCGSEPQETATDTQSTSEFTTSKAEVAKTNDLEEQTPVANDKTFGITPKQFGERLGIEAKEAGLGDVNIGKFVIQEGTVNDVFIEKLSDAVAMNGTVDKNGELKAITFIMGQTGQGDKEIMNMVVMAGLVARALNPELAKEETAGKVVDLLSKAVEGFEKDGEGDSSYTVDNVKYTATVNKTTGIWFHFEPV